MKRVFSLLLMVLCIVQCVTDVKIVSIAGCDNLVVEDDVQLRENGRNSEDKYLDSLMPDDDLVGHKYLCDNFGIDYVIPCEKSSSLFIPWDTWDNYYTTAEQRAELDEEIERVIGKIIDQDMTEYQKVKAIYDYMCSTITYDYDTLYDDSYYLKYTAYAALINKTAVCNGYAALFCGLALKAGVNAIFISGIAYPGTIYEGGHAWNIVEIDGLYYNLDSTWDAGYKYDYFLRNNENFIDHLRDPEYMTDDFNNAYPMATEDYVCKENPIVSGACGDGVVYDFELNTGLLKIRYVGEGTAKMSEFYIDSVYQEQITKCIVDSPVTSIGSYMFWYCTYLESVELPESLTEIGEYAFYGCERLQEIDIPDGVTKIGDYAFCYCRALPAVDIPDSVTAIGDSTFRYCESLKNVELPRDLKTVGEYAFYGCSSLLNVDIPDGVTSIGESAFHRCESLTSVHLPEGLATISDYAFYNCNSLTSVDIPDGVTSIGESAFHRCESLTSVHLPESLTVIGKDAFLYCMSLMSIDIPCGVVEVGDYAFYGCFNMNEITFNGDVPASCGSYIIQINTTIYYNDGASGWTTPTWTAPDGTVYNTQVIKASEPTKIGDLDSNGTVDVDDVLICLDLAFMTPTEEQLKLADLDKDSDVDVDDVLICLDLCFA